MSEPIRLSPAEAYDEWYRLCHEHPALGLHRYEMLAPEARAMITPRDISSLFGAMVDVDPYEALEWLEGHTQVMAQVSDADLQRLTQVEDRHVRQRAALALSKMGRTLQAQVETSVPPMAEAPRPAMRM